MSRVRCPSCATVLSVPDDGRTAVRCPSCGNKARVGEPAGRAERDRGEDRAPRFASRKASSRERKPVPKRRGRRLWWLPLVTVLPPCLMLLLLVPFSKMAAALALLLGTGVMIFAAIKVYLLFRKKGLTDLNETLPFFLRGGGALLISHFYNAFQFPKSVGVWVAVEMVALVLTVTGGVFFGILKDPSDAPALAGGQEPSNGGGNPPSVQAPPPAVTGDAVLDKALADLGGNNTVAWQVAADQLAKLQPNQHRAVIARKLAERANVSDAIPRQSIIRALGVWATSKEVPVLIDALRDEHAPARQEAFRALAKARDEQAVAPLVHCFLEGTNRFEAEQALKELGPMAEKEMLPLLDKDQEVFLRLSAIGVIKEIGTQESVPVLRAVAAEDNVHLKGPAQDALKAINARIRKGKGK